MQKSAMPEKFKRTVLTQESLRRLRNTKKELGSEVQNAHLNEFMSRLKKSGYSAKYRLQILKSAKEAYRRILAEDANGTKPLYRSRTWNKIGREKEKSQKVKFSLEIDYEDKKPTSDKDIKSIVNYGQVVKLIKKLTKNKHYNFLETLAEDVFDVLFKDRRIGKIMLQIEKLEILKDCTSVGIQITKKRSYEKL